MENDERKDGTKLISATAAAGKTIGSVTDRLLTLQEAADYLRVPAATIYQWRHKGVGPKSFRVGKFVRFRQSDIDAWLEDQAAI